MLRINFGVLNPNKILNSILSFALLAGINFVSVSKTFASDPDWRAGVSISPEGRANPYELSTDELKASVIQGQIYTQVYPVAVTGVLPPVRPVKYLLEETQPNWLLEVFQKLFHKLSGFKSIQDMMKWLGLHSYPSSSDSGVYQFQRAAGLPSDSLVGYGEVTRYYTRGSHKEIYSATGFTLSCATCHSGNLFGKTILGMSNRFPRANDFFIKAKKVSPFFVDSFFRVFAKATPEELVLINQIKTNLKRVGIKSPVTLGLDTSLAQVSLSLNHRQADSWATPAEYFENSPREDWLDDHPADSKPAVWWNVKYKNRWLSDGSVISGAPIYTNLIWNEIGRGADLIELEKWLDKNSTVVRDLTNVVFQSEAPRMTDFFPESHFDILKAKHGETLFEENCSRCHGHYLKNWSLPNSENQSIAEQIKTYKVVYHKKTPVYDVGTDPNRALGMQSLEQLNRLSISQKNGIFIQSQKGYVPPPLVGIWARWPYMHNNSIPSLCELLTSSAERVSEYWSGEADDPEVHFDRDCNGYPTADRVPSFWKNISHKFDTRREGLHNTGHDEGIFLEQGKELLTPEEKKDLIQYLQTL